MDINHVQNGTFDKYFLAKEFLLSMRKTILLILLKMVVLGST